MGRLNKLKFIIVILFVVFFKGFVYAAPKTVKIFKEYHGNFRTTVKGATQSQPPYIRVIRSKEGITHLFNQFRKIRNLVTHNKALNLERALSKKKFSSVMVIAILSHPTDNYTMEKIRIVEHESEQKIEVMVSYFHKNKEYAIPPFKSIFYRFYVVKNSPLPVLLSAKTEQKVVAKTKKESSQTVYGRLQNWDNYGKQLALIDRSKRKKRVFYIKGSLEEELRQYIGKFLALRGEVTFDSESIYEADLLVEKIVKVF